MAYPYDELSATQRQYPLVGSLADLLTASTAPDRTPQARMMAEFFGLPSMATTLDRISYGEPLTTGANQTLQMKPETAESLLSVIGAVAPSGKAAAPIGAGLERVGMAAERAIEPAVMRTLNKGGINAQMLQDMVRGSVSPMDVYHGSPYKFNYFDASKINTGEGAQAYGRGVYAAQNPNVAKRFQAGVSQAHGIETTYQGKPLSELYTQLENQSFKQTGAAADLTNQRLQIVESMMLDKSPEELLEYAKETGFDPSVLQWIEKDIIPNTNVAGYLYKADLPDEQIANMLDWDKPLSQQPEIVQKYFDIKPQVTQVPDDGSGHVFHATNGEYSSFGRTAEEAAQGVQEMLGYQLMRRIKGRPEDVADQLRQAGIPGVRYLDEMSRFGDNKTSNFVVFPGNEGLLQILERNGKKIR